MYKGEYYYEFDVSENQRKLARSRADAEKKDVHSKYTIDPLGIYSGYIGEVVFDDLFPAARYHNEHKDHATKYDFLLGEYKIDVKTSLNKTNEGPKPEYWRGYNIPYYVKEWWSIDGGTDYYVFCDTPPDFSKLYMYGMVSCKDFYLQATSFTFKNGNVGFSITHRQMFEMSVLPLYENEMRVAFENV